MIKLSISNIAWAAEYDNDMYQYLHEVGFDGLEIAPTRIFSEEPYNKLKDAKGWAEEMKSRYGLEIPSMQSIWYGHQERIFGTQEGRNFLIEYTKKAIDFAELIGCKNLVFGNPKNRYSTNLNSDYPVAIDFFYQIGEYAREHNTTIAIEPNPTIYNTNFINFTEQAVEMAYKCGSTGVKVNVDLGTIIYNKENINYLKQIPGYINHVHISEPGLAPIEKRSLHSQLFSVLSDIGYNKFVSIEMGKCESISEVKKIVDEIKKLSLLF